MFFVVRSNDSFNFPLGLIKYIVIVLRFRHSHSFVLPASVSQLVKATVFNFNEHVITICSFTSLTYEDSREQLINCRISNTDATMPWRGKERGRRRGWGWGWGQTNQP